MEPFDNNLERTKKLRLLDDVFFRNFMQENPKAIEFILKIILKKDDLEVVEYQTQKDLKSLRGKSAVFDVWAKDSQGNLYNIEIERTSSRATEIYVRWHKSILDSSALAPGQEIKELPDSYVIYITENDIYKKNQGIYRIETCVELDNKFVPTNNGAHGLIVNGSYDNDDDLGRLMHDFRETDPNKMYYKILRETADYLKNTKEGIEKMNSIVDEIKEEGRIEGRQEGRIEGRQEGRIEGRREGRIEGRQEGREEGKLELVSELFSRGYNFQEISNLFPGFSKEQLKFAQREALQNS